MKIIILLNVVSFLVVAHGFLQYPFMANYMLGTFLKSVEHDHRINLENWVMGEECNRECKHNDIKVCRFHFMMKYFQVMGG